jgi:AAA+ superfamily predicted ATPase
MATAIQLKALLNSFKDNDTEMLKSVAMQIVADEKQKGHEKLAEEIKSIIEYLNLQNVKTKPVNNIVNFIAPTGDLQGLFEAEYSTTTLNDLVLPNKLRIRIDRLIIEYNSRNKLREYNLLPRSKVLMVGASGTGKTMTASAIAGVLKLPIFKVQLDKLLTKYMGEASSKLRLIFDYIRKVRGVYFFDEFDAIGGSRNISNDVGEIRRILNTFLQFIEQAPSDSILLAATNYQDLLDRALFRRFDDILEYELPNDELRLKLFRAKLYDLPTNTKWDNIVKASNRLNCDDIVKICDNIHKYLILENAKTIPQQQIDLIIKERKSNNGGKQ